MGIVRLLDIEIGNHNCAGGFMDTKRLKELEFARAKVAALEKSIEAARTKELAGLPAQFGFDTTEAFLKAVRKSAGGKQRRGLKTKRRSRAVITDATRKKVKSLVEAGKTSAEIAQATGISIPSVQNIKKALGLTRPKKK